MYKNTKNMPRNEEARDAPPIAGKLYLPAIAVSVALGYLRWKHQEPGTRMEVETSTGRQAVELIGLPPVV